MLENNLLFPHQLLKSHKIDLDHIVYEMQRRKPGQSKIVTQRKEDDSVEFLSGIFEGKTTGTPIGFLIKNNFWKL